MGSARTSAAYAVTVSVVVNASATPKVIGCLPCSGLFNQCRSWLFCQKQSASATPKATSETTIRVRSSSRCSTTVSRSSWVTGFSFAMGARVSLQLLSFLFLVVLASHRILELAHATAERLAEPGQTLRPEDHEHDDEDDDQLKWADVRHVLIVECGNHRDRRFATFFGSFRRHDPRADRDRADRHRPVRPVDDPAGKRGHPSGQLVPGLPQPPD